MQPSPAPNDDLDLRNRILDGDRGATEDFFERHLDALYEFVHYRVGGNRSQAEDVVQDTLLVALERLAAFDGRSSLYTWLCGIAKNKIRAARRKRRPVLIEDLLDEADPEIDALTDELVTLPVEDPRYSEVAIEINDRVVNSAVIPLIHRASASAVSNAIEGLGTLNGWDSEYWNVEDWTRTG